ncbi:TRAIP.2 family protein [Megaselia abdita]
MNLNCPICMELFVPLDEVYCTTCGHMFHHRCLLQWLERCQTCPQCRNRTTQRNIFKIYFNHSDVNTVTDNGSLQRRLDRALLQIERKGLEISKSKKEISLLKETKNNFLKTISGLEGKIAQNNHLFTSYAQQMQILRNEVNVLESLRSENEILKWQLAGKVDSNTVYAHEIQTLKNYITRLESEVAFQKSKLSKMATLKNDKFYLKEKLCLLALTYAFITYNIYREGNNLRAPTFSDFLWGFIGKRPKIFEFAKTFFNYKY